MIRCTVGVMAYNEEQSIGPLLHALLVSQVQHCELVEIIVVASGCTDQTVPRAQAIARAHPLIVVDVEPVRSGKAAAINRLIARARGEVIVLVGADTLPDPAAIEMLVRPFADPAVGMTGARVIPLNDPWPFMGFAVQVLWHVHHVLALRYPKLGELVAFRNTVPAVPQHTATDEVALEALIHAQGYQLVYVPDALVYNYGPETVQDFLHQRRRIFAGHLQIAAEYGYRAASMPLLRLMRLATRAAQQNPRLLPQLLVVAALECIGRMLGWLDTQDGISHQIWRPIASSKRVVYSGDLLLVMLQCQANTITSARMLALQQRMPASLGQLFWWDYRMSQVMIQLRGPRLPRDAVTQLVGELASYFAANGARVQRYRVVHFASYASGHTLESDRSPVLFQQTGSVNTSYISPATGVCR